MPEKSRLDAILGGKCPRCRKGNMFPYSMFRISKFMNMNKECPVCHLFFEREPGFFFGAMYISYAFSVAIFISVGVILSFLGDYPLHYYLIGVCLSIILLFPFMFRYSRILFLHFFGGVRYEPKYGN
jgi:hypothetical protein